MPASIPKAYDHAIETAQIDPDSIRWVNASTIEVQIDGLPYQRKLQAISVEGLRDALSACLSDHCALAAVWEVCS